MPRRNGRRPRSAERSWEFIFKEKGELTPCWRCGKLSSRDYCSKGCRVNAGRDKMLRTGDA